jgi:cardiolipin synthase
VNNVSLVHRASRHARPHLAREGVRIFFQPPPFAHTKLFLVDDYYALAGSANLDPRSLFLNFELNMEIFDRAFCSTLQAYFNAVLARSREGEEEPRGRALMPRLLDAAVWLFSPYL